MRISLASDSLGFEKDCLSRMPHGCIRTMGMGIRRNGLQIFRKDLAGVHLGRTILFFIPFIFLYLSP